jgi:hypothetical protein
LPEILGAIADVEAGVTWQQAKDCLTKAGAPPFTNALPSLPGIPDGAVSSEAEHAFYLDWISSTEINIQFSEQRTTSGTPQSRAFADCTEPYFEELQRALQEPRKEFVEEHREELVELQRQFASFDVAED